MVRPHGLCDARPTVPFPAAERHRLLAGTRLCCLMTKIQRCERLVTQSHTDQQLKLRLLELMSSTHPIALLLH